MRDYATKLLGNRLTEMNRILPKFVLDVILRGVNVTPAVRVVQADGGQSIQSAGLPFNVEHYSSPFFSWCNSWSTYSLERRPVRSISSPMFSRNLFTLSAGMPSVGMPGFLARMRANSFSIMALSSSIVISFINEFLH